MNNKSATKFFVKPLYKNIKPNTKKGRIRKKTLVVDIDSTINLSGHDCHDNNIKSDESTKHNNKNDSTELPGSCEIIPNSPSIRNKKIFQSKKVIRENTKLYEKTKSDCGDPNNNRKCKIVVHNKHNNNKINEPVEEIMKYTQETNIWLRVYPATRTKEESLWSVIFRCIFCQFGLMSFLVIWTVIGVFTIHCYEGPNEEDVSSDFGKKQNQLVIDLATELRQNRWQACCCTKSKYLLLTELQKKKEVFNSSESFYIMPVSMKWRETIESRLEEERRITLQAVAKGAMLNPGRFWNLSGTFLFTIYVMTALGFGAPVPHTIGGRVSALVYALFAVPAHFSFVLYASRCVVAHVESLQILTKRNLSDRNSLFHGRNEINQNGDPSYSDMNNNNKKTFSCKLIKILGFLWTGRGLPLITMLYYAIGAITFGFLRNKTNTEIAMFPLEFTTTGGLEHVPAYVKVLYGFYVEGAIMLLASIVATIRRCSHSAIDVFSDKYRLYYIKKVSTLPISKSRDDGINFLPR